MFSTVAVIFLEFHQNQHDIVQKTFSKLLEAIQKFEYHLQIVQLTENNKENLEKALRNHLIIYDIVIVIGSMSEEEVFQAIVKVYDEHWQIYKEIQDTKVNDKHRHFQIIQEEQNQILWLHRFYFIESKSIEGDFNLFLKQLEYFKKKPLYSKVFKYAANENIQRYIDCLVCCENGIKTSKTKDNEIVVSSGSLVDINCVQKHLESQFAIEDSCVIDENEDFILHSNFTFIQEAIDHIKDCFDKYKPENVFISFNGGKDCTVLLHLMLIILKKYYPDYKQPVFCMYVQSPKPFPQVTAFIEQVLSYYKLNIRTLTLGIKDGLNVILQEKPNLKACLMGTRRMDPFSANLSHFQATDNGWPDIMRVSPLLDWEFAHVWDYLINFKVPYCKLYDDGYTSLGNVDNTAKNPQLVNEATGAYYPAYKLLTSNKERSGRK